MATFKVTVVCCSHRNVMVSVLANLWTLRDCPDPKITLEFQDGDALISRSRSIRATKFLKSDSDMLAFIDDDVAINSFDFTKLMWLAWKEKYPIIGAAYATKSKTKPGFAIRPLTNDVTMNFGASGGVYEVKDVSTGCVVIRREVLETMVEKEAVHLCRHGAREYYPFFQHREVLEDDGVWEDKSEDWFFNWNARKLGFKVYCDTSIKTEHVGPYAFTWDDVLEVNQGKRETHPNIQFKVVMPQPFSVPTLNGNEAAKAIA
jgi:hypothetical protein